MGSFKLALLLVFVSCVERSLSASCIVDSFSVKEDFDPKRVSTKNTLRYECQEKKRPNISDFPFMTVCWEVVCTAEERPRGAVPAGQHLRRVHH